VKPRADADGFDADPEIAAWLYLGTFKRRMVAKNLVEIRNSLGLAPEGDEQPPIVPNHGFAACYSYVGGEKLVAAIILLN
jgi:hypothetical protein